jgi:hypothetical protein
MSDQSESLSGLRYSLVSCLMLRCGYGDRAAEWLERAEFESMDDGSMGGYYVGGRDRNVPVKVKATASYKDCDGVDVFISLYLDESGVPKEVEFWKVNFDKLLKFPTDNELFDVSCL